MKRFAWQVRFYSMAALTAEMITLAEHHEAGD